MIKNILDLLSTNEHLGQTERVEIAKGKYKRPTNFSEVLNKIKRYKSWLKRQLN
jgi:hypothetical protein